MRMMLMGEGGSITPERVVMIASLQSEPVKRFVKYTDAKQVVNMTYGYPQRSVIVFDNGMIAITRYSVEELTTAINHGEEVYSDDRVTFQRT